MRPNTNSTPRQLLQHYTFTRSICLLRCQPRDIPPWQAVYPIPVRGSTIRDDLEALEACQLIKIERVAPLPAHLLPATGASTATRTADLATGTGREPTRGKAGPVRFSKLDDVGAAAARRKNAGRLLLSFRDLVLRQVTASSTTLNK